MSTARICESNLQAELAIKVFQNSETKNKKSLHCCKLEWNFFLPFTDCAPDI
jgi:hypothetical protein